MRDRLPILLSTVIMISALLCMGFHLWIKPLPDLAVRMTGIILMVNLAVFVYLSVRTKKKVKL